MKVDAPAAVVAILLGVVSVCFLNVALTSDSVVGTVWGLMFGGPCAVAAAQIFRGAFDEG